MNEWMNKWINDKAQVMPYDICMKLRNGWSKGMSNGGKVRNSKETNIWLVLRISWWGSQMEGAACAKALWYTRTWHISLHSMYHCSCSHFQSSQESRNYPMYILSNHLRMRSTSFYRCARGHIITTQSHIHPSQICSRTMPSRRPKNKYNNTNNKNNKNN